MRHIWGEFADHSDRSPTLFSSDNQTIIKEQLESDSKRKNAALFELEDSDENANAVVQRMQRTSRTHYPRGLSTFLS